jgi:hypothetical protein
MRKTLYMLHIPKTGGVATNIISQLLEAKGLYCYPGISKTERPYQDYAYIHGHFGTQPVEQYPSIEVACLVRDPIDRSISSFLWMLKRGTFDKKEAYSNDLSIIEKLRYYLFEDAEFSENKNLMTRFLSNPVDTERFHTVPASYQRSGSLKGGVIDWNIRNSNTSVDSAKLTLDKASILGTTDNFDQFIEKIFVWFLQNYDVDIKDEYKLLKGQILDSAGLPTINYSIHTDSDNIDHTTKSLRLMLSSEDLDRINLDNSMDLEIFNYAKTLI